MSSMDLIREFQAMGCKDNFKCSVASMIYLDLKYDRALTDVEKKYDSELDVIYFLTHGKSFPTNTILPISSSTKIDTNKMEEIQRKLEPETRMLALGICDSNSEILYYSVTNDFDEKQ